MLPGFGPTQIRPASITACAKSAIFGEEAVARVDRLGASLLRSFDDLLADEVALTRRARPDVHRLVRHAHVQRLRIGVRIDRDGADPEPLRGADHAARNLATVCDEEGLKHRPAFRTR